MNFGEKNKHKMLVTTSDMKTLAAAVFRYLCIACDNIT